MRRGYPILVILTNQSCSHCVKMRGKYGWPSNNFEPTFKAPYERWNDEFFIACLTGVGAGDLDHFSNLTQKIRVIEMNFDKLTSDCKLLEVTFFDLDSEYNSISGLPPLIIKKYKPISEDNSNVFFQKRNKNGFIDSKELKNTKFDSFIQKFVPLEAIKNYFHIFPNFVYVHSTIWEDAIVKNSSLYARVQGFTTVRDGLNPKIYKVLREKRSNYEEKEKNPSVVLKRLLDNDLEPLFFPIDHIE